MDGKRFDHLTRLLAAGRSRRSILKGLFGVAGGVAFGNVAFDEADARRSSSTPQQTPVPCPDQIVCGTFCCDPGQCNQFEDGCCEPGTTACVANSTGCCAVCEAGATPCGYDCCTASQQCCDSECCDGACYGEELCCPTPRIFNEISWICCELGTHPCGELCIPDGTCCTDDSCSDFASACVAGRCSGPGGECYAEPLSDGTPFEPGISVCIGGEICTLAGCGPTDCEETIEPNCGQTIQCPLLCKGSGCLEDSECVTGACKDTCVDPAIVGGPCDSDPDCYRGLICDSEGSCRVPILGDCSFDPNACAFGLVCDLASGNLCKVPPGGTCSTSDECTYGNACDSDESTCKTANGFGCQDDDECVDGYCIATSCQPGLSGLFGMCDSDDDCADPLLCFPKGGTNSCLIPFGETCTTTASCGTNFVCDSGTGTCLVGPGGGCTENSDCSAENNLYCNSTTSECETRTPVGGDCTPGSGECESLNCLDNILGDVDVCCVLSGAGACETDADCCESQRPPQARRPISCRGGQCRDAWESGDPPENNFCAKNNDCGGSLICCLDETESTYLTCVEASACPSPPPPVGEGGFCETDDDCTSGLTCTFCAATGKEKRCLDQTANNGCCRNGTRDHFACGDNYCCDWQCTDSDLTGAGNEESCGGCNNNCYDLALESGCYENDPGTVSCNEDGYCVFSRVCDTFETCNPTIDFTQDPAVDWTNITCVDWTYVDSIIGGEGYPCSSDDSCNDGCICTSPCTGGYGGIWCTESNSCSCEN